jgi:thiamine transport system substrate-binding protein
MKWPAPLVALVVVAACGGRGVDTVTLLTHDSFVVSDGVLESFTRQTGVSVEVVRAGDAGAVVNQAILTKDNPLADVIFGIDNALLPRAIAAGILEEYRPEGLAEVPDALAVGTDGMATPVDFGDVCVNYDLAALGELGVSPPRSLDDLVAPQYAGLLAVEDPSLSSPGLAFLLATIATYGENGWGDYWRDLVDNDVAVTAGWEEAYYGAFSLYGGDRPLVVSYASSPPAEVIFAAEPTDTAPTAVMTASCYRQVEYAAVLAGSSATAAARDLIDFMLTIEFQQDIPLNMFVFPANERAALPPEFLLYTELPADPVMLTPTSEDIERWVAGWADIVLR